MAFNKKTHLRQNIDALKTAFTLDRERRAPTPEEERTLGAYSGFGAIKEVLENPTGKPDKDGMATLVAELHEVIRANTPDEREYKRYMDGIKNSVLTAFYTPPKVADAIVEAIWDTRIVPKRILDPSAGTGVFVTFPNVSAKYFRLSAHHSSNLPSRSMRSISSCVPDTLMRIARTWLLPILRVSPASSSLL